MKRVGKHSEGTAVLKEERERETEGIAVPLRRFSRTPLKGRIKDFSELAATQSETQDREQERGGRACCDGTDVRWN